jgi:hypothetical protein
LDRRETLLGSIVDGFADADGGDKADKIERV